MLSSRTKKIIFLLLALAVIGLFIYLFSFFQKNIQPVTNGQNHTNGLTEDKLKPNSQIRSPESNTWHNHDFEISVLDEDFGLGIDPKGCQFKVLSYSQNGTVHSSGWIKRQCNFGGTATVGSAELCRYEGRQACWIYISSQDKAGNSHTPSEEAKSIRNYNIDWTKPEISKIFINQEQEYPINIAENTEYNFKVLVSDNLKVTGCTLYINSENIGKMSPEIPGCGTECTFSKNFTIKKTGSYNIFAVCSDAASNVANGEITIVKTNIPPKISSCGVAPTDGDTKTDFQFSLQAADTDNDQLTVEWNFGDGKTSKESEPTHGYETAGTYKPSVTISDPAGAKDTCSTAWVIISQ